MSSRITKLANVIIPVADQDRAVEFYIEKLGLEKRLELPFGPDFRWIEVAPTGADTSIALCPPGPDVTPGGKQTGISLQVDDADAYHAELKARGVDVDEEVGRFGDAVPPTFWLRDHEGNVLQVIEIPGLDVPLPSHMTDQADTSPERHSAGARGGQGRGAGPHADLEASGPAPRPRPWQ